MNNIKCPACGLGNRFDAANCLMCGCELSAQTIAHNAKVYQGAAQTETVAPAFQPSVFQPYPFTPPPQNNYGNNYGQGNFQNGGPRTNINRHQNLKTGLAVASLVIGGLSFFTMFILIGIVFAPVSLILGIVAFVKANRRPRVYGGKGMAIAGIVMSSAVLVFLPLIAAIAIPNLLASRRAANESGTIASIRTIAEAEEQLLASGQTCMDLPELAAKGLVDRSFSSGTKFGYRYTIANLPAKGCEIYAVPTEPKGAAATGSRSFYYSTEDKIIRAAPKQGKMADKNDLPLESNPIYKGSNGYEDFGGGEKPDKNKAMSNMRMLHSAAMTYQATTGAGKCGTIDDLEKAGLIRKDLGDGVAAGYRYNLTSQCAVSATPLNGGQTLTVDNFGNIR